VICDVNRQPLGEYALVIQHVLQDVNLRRGAGCSDVFRAVDAGNCQVNVSSKPSRELIEEWLNAIL
jgi:hypothetical protein